ncbi:unnamed protein product [Urochloa humidicola]
MQQHLGNATSTTFFHHLTDLWKSHRGTVIRIESLVLVAIILSFFLAAFGSCRRWSNRWIVQKGFLAAHVLSLSLGTYGTGLMQSSSVKSEMYPAWAVSLLTLFVCVDSITAYNGLDYKGPLSETIFLLCLYCGYVLLMSISTICGVIGNTAIGVMCAITFIKGFHMSLALVLPSKARSIIENMGIVDKAEQYAFSNDNTNSELRYMVTYLPIDDMETAAQLGSRIKSVEHGNIISMADICSSFRDNSELAVELSSCKDVCLAYSLSHTLQQRFLGFNYCSDVKSRADRFRDLAELGEEGIDYKRALKVIEIELAFLYEVFFTSNAYLHFYQAKAASLWVFASFIGICFVGAVVAIPETMTSRYRNSSTGPGIGTIIVVDTTKADLIITLVILVCLALLHLVQLIRIWTSNWARVAFACKFASMRGSDRTSLWMKMKFYVVTKINWFDNYLWQDKLGQYSLVEASRRRGCRLLFNRGVSSSSGCLRGQWARLLRMLGLHYVGQVLRELWGSVTNSTSSAVRLQQTDVKESIVRFLRTIKDARVEVPSFPGELDTACLPFIPLGNRDASDAYSFTERVMQWHIVTCYCKLTEQQDRIDLETGRGSSSTGREIDNRRVALTEQQDRIDLETGREIDNRRVAIALSKYVAYLVVSAPELLPGPTAETKRAYVAFDKMAREVLDTNKDKLVALREAIMFMREANCNRNAFHHGLRLGDELVQIGIGRYSFSCWEFLADLWMRVLLYAAPSGNVKAHMQHLSQGGEFITISGLCCPTSVSTGGMQQQLAR